MAWSAGPGRLRVPEETTATGRHSSPAPLASSGEKIPDFPEGRGADWKPRWTCLRPVSRASRSLLQSAAAGRARNLAQRGRGCVIRPLSLHRRQELPTTTTTAAGKAGEAAAGLRQVSHADDVAGRLLARKGKGAVFAGTSVLGCDRLLNREY